MIYQHQYFQLDTESRKVFDENGKELVLTGNAYRMLVFLCDKKHANLSEIGDYLDYAKEYTENHIRQYRYKIETIIGRDVIEYKNGIYSIIGNVQECLELARNERNTDLLRQNTIQLTQKDNELIETMKFIKFPAIVAALILVISLFGWPYSFYTFLRIVITCVSIFYAYYFYSKKIANSWFWILLAIAILFNPIVPIYIKDKSVWMVIDVIVALFFGILIFRWNKFSKNYE